MSPRLFVPATFVSFRRSRRIVREGTALIQLEGVSSAEDAQFYLGKRVAYVYSAGADKDGKKLRTIWGTLVATHGNSGVCRAKFHHNLPAKALGESVRVLLYPNRNAEL